MAKIWIIIATHNGMKWIPRCLESTKPYPVIIVDNNSVDGTVSFIKENHPNTTLLEQKKNLGFGQANNIGISYALEKGADYVFLLNQDAYLQLNCIEELLEVHKENLEVGVLSPVHLNGKGRELDSNFLKYLNRYKVINFLLSDGLRRNLKTLYNIGFINAAAWLIPRKIIEVVGGFDPLFFHYGEDRNYCQRLAYHGYSVAIAPGAFIFHDREDRAKKQSSLYSKSYYEEFERYIKVDFGDINQENFEERYNRKIQYHQNKQLKNLLFLRFREAKDSQIKRKILIEIKPELLKSRTKNVRKIN